MQSAQLYATIQPMQTYKRLRVPLAAKSPPKPSPAPFRYDDAQQAVIECNDRIVVAEAFAGAGKTTTAIGFTDARPDARALYICFNRANAEEARRKFGGHVECKSTHAVAWAAVGRHYKNQLVNGSWKARLLQEEIKLPDVRTAALAQGVLNNFFSSADESPNVLHALSVGDQYGANEAELDRAMDAARVAWSRMQSPGQSISVPHDAYLKRWALSAPQLPFDQIILDEAQDTNPVIVDVIRKQRSANMLLIGDRHQAIYGFRKANNAMELFCDMGATVLKIPKTWRFGPDIARVANALLFHFKNEDTEIVGAGPAKPRARGASVKVILSRTNAGLFREAAEVEGRGIHWVGGIEGYRVDSLMDAWHLQCGKKDQIYDPVMRMYQSWRQFEDEAESTQDPEARLLCKFINTYGKDTPGLVRAFREHALPAQDGARLVLSTAHKAKGLDFDQVTIGDDFECINKAQKFMRDNAGVLEEVQRQEINLLYVAITRARHELILNNETKNFLAKLDQFREQLQSARPGGKESLLVS